MSKINVYSSSASNAIKVFDANSNGLKPDNAILVTTGTEPSNAIQINVGEKNWSSIAVNFGSDSPVPPGPEDTAVIYGKTYKTTKIANKTWMAEDLLLETTSTIKQSQSYIPVELNNSTSYVYNPIAIQEIESLVSADGWRIPKKEDWENIYQIFSGDAKALASTFGWQNQEQGTNESKFNAIPFGYIYLHNGNYNNNNSSGRVAAYISNIPNLTGSNYKGTVYDTTISYFNNQEKYIITTGSFINNDYYGNTDCDLSYYGVRLVKDN